MVALSTIWMLCVQGAFAQRSANAPKTALSPTTPASSANRDSTWWQRAAQTLGTWATFSGSASLFGELYTVPSGVQGRRPPGTARLNVQATVTLFEQITIPLELLLSTEQVQFRQPFNQFSLAPQLGKNVRLYAGFHTMTLSPLSAADVRVQGGGADVKIGNIRIMGSAGQSQRAVLPELSTNATVRRAGNFAQVLIMGRVAFESDSGVVVGLNVVRGRDDAASLLQIDNVSGQVQNSIEAKDALTASIDLRAPLFGKTVNLEAEFGASRNGSLWFGAGGGGECGFGTGAPIVSTDKLRLDYAARLVASYENPSSPFALRLRGEYVGPGYTTLGFPQFVNDRFEADVAPQLRLFDGRLSVGGSIGYATDNLLGDRATTASRLIGSANVSAQISDNFGIDAQYQNYGIRVAPPPNYGIIQPTTTQEQLRSEQVFGLIMLAPRGTFTIAGAMQNVSLTASWQQFSDANSATRRQTENSSQMVRLLWNTMLQKLALTLNAGYTSNRSALAEFAATDVSLAASHPLFEGKTTPTLTLGWTRSSESSGLEARLTANLRATYRVTKQLEVMANLQANYYLYKPGSRSPSYGEAQMSVEIRQRL